MRYAFSQDSRRAVRCSDCEHLFLNPPPQEAPPYKESPTTFPEAAQFFRELKRYRGDARGRLLLIGASGSAMEDAATQSGFGVTTVADPSTGTFGKFDLCVLDHTLSRAADPIALLRACHTALRPGGKLALISSTIRGNGPLFADGESHRFDAETLQTTLFFSGYAEVIVEPSRLAKGSVLVFSKAVPIRERRLLSVVVPAFNEAGSLATLMDALLAKTLPDLDIEVVLVESNSTDGTRDIALEYSEHPRVHVILEDKPRGKGHAVRTGLAHATGDFVLIQDADLEYDLEDYDALLEPLIAGREAFVLGSRHSGSVWKMRQFSGQLLLSGFLNWGHWIFTTLVNVLFGQRLKDPFTMFKVFRRDCLFGLRFECNRFDFDYELLVKLIRKGYKPIELPVNYRSRSFKQGKKVSMFRDPMTWLWALAKLRIATINPLSEVETKRAVLRAESRTVSHLTPRSFAEEIQRCQRAA